MSLKRILIVDDEPAIQMLYHEEFTDEGYAVETAFASGAQLPLDFFSKDELNQVEAVQYSAAVFRATGAQGVAEPAALLAAGPGARLLVPKVKYPDVTVAVACMTWPYPVSL